MTASRRRTAIILLLAAIYAACFAAIKAGLDNAPPLLFAGLRVLIAGAALLAVQAALRRPLIPDREDRRWLPALTLTGIVAAYGAMFLSPGRTGASIASVLGNTQPLIAIMLAAAFLGERVTRRRLSVLALGLAGVTLVAMGALAGPNAYGIDGPALALAASAGAAAGSVIVKRMGTRSDVLVLAAWQLIGGGLVLLAAAAVFERDAAVTWTPRFAGLLLFLALPGTAVAIPAWYWLVQRESVGRLTLSLFLVPVFGLAIGVLLLDETVSRLAIAGAALTIVAVGVAGRESSGGADAVAPAARELLTSASAPPQPALSERWNARGDQEWR